MASPVFDRRGDTIGSLGVFGARFPAKRVTECAMSVKHSASLLSALLGHRQV
jgi:DNA-binding IclR family transcriptional regulator